VRQGGVLSPHLFATYIDSVFEKVAALAVDCHVKWACVSILMYADDILLIALTVSALQLLLNICQCELQYLDVAINAKKSVCSRFGPRYKQPCSNLLTSGGRAIVWSENVRYLGVHIVSSKLLLRVL